MNAILSGVVGAVIGALVTWLAIDREQPPHSDVAPDVQDEAVADETPTEHDAAPKLEASGEQPAPKVHVGPGGNSFRFNRKMAIADVMRGLQKEFGGQLQAKDERIQALEAELKRLKATLPKPEILQTLEKADIAQYEQILTEIKSIATERLLTPPAHVRETYAELLSMNDTGVARILPRGRFEAIVEPRGGGAYWSFKTGSNNYNEEPDLELQQGYYSTGFYGSAHGYLMSLGGIEVEDVPDSARDTPLGLEGQALEQWAWMWKQTEAKSERRPDRRRIPGEAPDLDRRIKAEHRTTYLLRAILPGEHDLLVAFRAAETDDDGHTLVYRILHEFEMPSRR